MAEETSRYTILAPGIAEGTLCFPEHPVFAKSAGQGQPSDQDVQTECKRFKHHAGGLAEEIRSDIEQVEQEGRDSEAEILRAHTSILQDQEFHDRVHRAIEEMELAAEDAVERVLEELTQLLTQSGSDIFQERAADFRDLAARLREHLTEQTSGFDELMASVNDPVPAVPEIFPSIVLRGHRQGVRAFITENGTSFAHAAILAKSFGIPVIRVPAISDWEEQSGLPVLVHGTEGSIVVHPSEQEWSRADAARPSHRTTTASPIRLWLNVTDPEQLQAFDWESIEGVGLYRTESLFMSISRRFPSEEEQLEVYSRFFESCRDRPVTVRTVDIGGDKPIEHMMMGPQDNPQLGLRAHRLYRYHPEILVTQIRAILRAAPPGTPIRIIYPLIETLDQWRFVQELTDRAVTSLAQDGLVYCSEFQRGVLIETPIAAWMFDRFAANADFLSVGTNDLVQYLFAVDRNNANVGFMYQPEHPAVLQVLKELTGKARAADKQLTLCGEIAGDARLLPLLVGLGIENFSVNPAAIPALQETLASIDQHRCTELARACLTADGIEEVKGKLEQWHGTSWEADSLPGETRDPVCGMAVDGESTPYIFENAGERHYFCSGHCLELFRERYR